MAEQHDQFSNAREDPPDSVPDSRVRHAAWIYVGPLVAFVVAGGVLVWHFTTSPPNRQATAGAAWNAVGTTGQTSPGGHSPDPVPPSPEKEIEERGVVRDLSEPPAPRVDPALMLTDLTQVRDLRPEQIVGRRVDVQGVSVVDVKRDASFEVQDGATRVAVVMPEGSPAVHRGQRVNIIGTMERSGAGVRIRASRVDVRE
jgi:hypothetical protein